MHGNERHAWLGKKDSKIIGTKSIFSAHMVKTICMQTSKQLLSHFLHPSVCVYDSLVYRL